MARVEDVIACVPSVWKTEAAFWSWVKGGIRKSLWSRHPVKIAYINARRKKIPNPNLKGNKPEVWGGTCEICQQDYVQSNMECDHRDETTAHLTKQEHLQSCFEKLCLVTFDDLRWVCKECHAIHSHSQKTGLSFEEARLDKQVIAFAKKKSTEQIRILTEEVKCETIASNSKGREAQFREYLKGVK